MSSRKFASTTISDKEDKLGLTPEGVNELLAKAQQSAAITDKFGTDVNGALIQTVMMLLREANSQNVTAGISGIQGYARDMPAVWTGGTHEAAIAVQAFLDKINKGITPNNGEYASLAKTALLHNGAGRFGDFIVLESGTVIMVDPLTAEVRLIFSIENLPLIADLVGGVSSSGNITVGSGTTTSSIDLTGSANITQGNGKVDIGDFNITVSGRGKALLTGASSFIQASVVMYRDGIRYRNLGSAIVLFTGSQDADKSENIHINPISTTLSGAGLYSFKLEIEKGGDVSSQNATSTSFPFIWEATLAGIKRQEYGRNGLMFFYSNNHFHFTEFEGLDIRGKTNMPGVLAKGRVASNGARDAKKYWGAKNNTTASITKPSGVGSYRVPVDCPNGNYDVNISPRTPNRMFHVGVTTKTYFDVYFRDHNGNPADSDFSYTVLGNNY